MKDLIAKLQIDANCALGAIWMHIDAQAARIAELEAQIATRPADTDNLRETYAKDAEEFGDHLNTACWAFMEAAPNGSITADLWNNSKKPIRAAILKYIELVSSTALQAPVREVPEADLWELLPNDAWYLDPPDGGNVSLLEQLRRMSVDAGEWRKLARVGRAPKWISVADKLPEFRHECTTSGCEVSDSILIYGETEFGTTGCGFGHARDDGTWQCYEAEYDQLTVSKVTHWMPLPAAPVQPEGE